VADLEHAGQRLAEPDREKTLFTAKAARRRSQITRQGAGLTEKAATASAGHREEIESQEGLPEEASKD